MIEVTNIYLLVGPKGAGKTYLSGRMETELGIPFVRVEPIWLNLMSEMQPGSKDFDQEGLNRVTAAIQKNLQSHSSVVLESTGTAPWFSKMLDQLAELGRLVIIKVTAPEEICVERIHSRDAAEHIPVSDDRIHEINHLARRVELPWFAVVENTSIEAADAFLNTLK